MKKLLNTLYVTTEDAYLSLNGETVEVIFGDDTHKQIPLHTLNAIVSFSYKGASPALMGKCAEAGVLLSFFTPFGRYLCDTGNCTNGNVYLRRTQFRWADDEAKRLSVIKNMIIGKLYNTKYLILHYMRDHPLQTDCDRIRLATDRIGAYLEAIKTAADTASIRGIEGNAAAEYFGVFNELILQNKKVFAFDGRSRRPPTDPVNCLLSFAYSLLANECSAGLRSVGLDPFVGLMHTDRPGRCSLSLDMMEELRPIFADRFVLTLINNRIFNEKSFMFLDNGAVILTDDARKQFIAQWQAKKREEIIHPFLKEKIQWGLVPYVQALLISRLMRGDLDGYPPFLKK